jgi:alpha-tubulin suppressor-like RCC1 family protein
MKIGLLVCLLACVVLASCAPTLFLHWAGSEIHVGGVSYQEPALRLGHVDADFVDLHSIVGACPLAISSLGQVWTPVLCNLGMFVSMTRPNLALDQQLNLTLDHQTTFSSIPEPLASVVVTYQENWALTTNGKLYHFPSFLFRTEYSNLSDVVPTIFSPSMLDNNEEDSSSIFTRLQDSFETQSVSTSKGFIYMKTLTFPCLLGFDWEAIDLAPEDLAALKFSMPVNIAAATSPDDMIWSNHDETAIAVVDNEIYVWGSRAEGALGMPSTSECQTIPFHHNVSSLWSVTPVWKHVVAHRILCLVIASNGTTLLLGGGSETILEYPLLTDFLVSAGSGNPAATLKQVVAATHSIHFLFQDGSVYGWLLVDTKGLPYLLSELPGEYLLPVRSHFGTALPDNYKITKIASSSYAQGMSAMAIPKTVINSAIAPLITEPTIDDIPLVQWDLPPAYYTITSEFNSTAWVDMRHMPQNNNFQRLASRITHTLAITTSGQLLARGKLSYAVSPVTSEVDWQTFMEIPTKFFDNETIIDIAVSSTDSFALTESGRLFNWGTIARSAITKKRDSHQKSSSFSSSKRVETPTDWYSYASVRVITPSMGADRFISIYAFDGLVAAIDNLRRLWTWGSVWTLSDTAFLPHLHENLYAEFGEIKHFTFATENTFYVVTEKASNQSFFIKGVALLEGFSSPVNDTHAAYFQIDTSESSLDLMTVSQLIANTSCFILSSDGIYGYGNDSTWFGGESGEYVTPTPIVAEGLPPPESIIKLALNQHLYILASEGRLFASCGDVLSFCIDEARVAPILELYSVQDIFSSSGKKGSPLSLAIVSPVTQPKPIESDAHHLSLVFGYYMAGMAIDARSISGTDDMIRMLPSGHPANLQNSSIHGGYGICFLIEDGVFESGKPRLMIHGGETTSSAIPSYLATSIPNSDIIYRKIINQKLFFFNADCSITVLDISGSSTVDPLYSAELPVVDEDYPARYLQHKSLQTHYAPNTWNNLACSIEGNPLMHVSCSSLSSSVVDLMGYHWCASISSNGSIFIHKRVGPVSLSVDDAPSCSTGMFGNVATCDNHSPESEFRLGYAGSFLEHWNFNLKPFQGISVGSRHGMALLPDSRVVIWGLNDMGQLGVDPEEAASAPIPFSIDFIVCPVTRVLAVGRTSFIICANTSIQSFGSNQYGMLGRYLSLLGQTIDWNSGLVSIPPEQFVDFTCSTYSCYVLFPSGVIWSWGVNSRLSLGRRTSSFFDAVPGPANLLTFPGPMRKITEIHTNQHGSVIVRAALSTSTAPQTQPALAPHLNVPFATSPPSCIGSAPDPSFTCINGVWTKVGDFVVGGPNGTETVIPITGPTVILGNLTIQPGGTITISPPGSIIGNSNAPLLNVTGCFVLDGELKIELTEETWKSFKSKLNSKQVLLVESSCLMLSGGAVTQVVTTPKDCRKTSATISDVDRPGGRHGLVSVFNVNRSKCQTWWIILLSVIGGILVIVSVILIAYQVHQKRILNSAISKVTRKPKV